MDDRQRDLDRRIRAAQRKEFFRQLSEAKLLIVIGAILLAVVVGGAIFSSAPTKLQATVLGRTMNEATARASKSGQAVRMEVVQLDNGAIVDVNMTTDHPVPQGTVVKIEIYEKDFGP